MSDWRLQNQESYLKGAELAFHQYQPPRDDWDHDHCEFCNGKFALSGGDFVAGYATAHQDHWICQDCFDDFKERFGLVVKE